jgi:uncharacterized membrane protein YgaE (UPF0421/DUF939 family)
MARKSKTIGLAVALGAALGAILGVAAGHVAIWLAIGVAIGMAIGGAFRRNPGTCPECEAIHKTHVRRLTTGS